MRSSYSTQKIVLALLRLKVTDTERTLGHLSYKRIFALWQFALDEIEINEVLAQLPQAAQEKLRRVLARIDAQDSQAWRNLENAMRISQANPDYHYYVVRSRLFREDVLRASDGGMPDEIVPYNRMISSRSDEVYFHLIHQRLILQPKSLDNMTLWHSLLNFREPKKEKKGYQHLSVYFGTNRADRPCDEKGTEFLLIRNDQHNPAGELTLGRAFISVPVSHVYGKLERPAPWWKIWEGNTEDVDDHFVIHTVEKLAQADWLKEADEQYPNKEGMLFIHGYSNTFDDALFKTAQLKVDLKFEGIALCFSWASCGVWQEYAVDEGTVGWSTQHLQAFIDLVVNKLQLTRLHIVAHSMGNRALLDMLRQWQPSQSYNPIRTLVLAAPDIDTGTLAQLDPHFARYPAVTLYASTKDVAINISQSVHRYPRAGDAQPSLVLKHMETVDVSATDTELFSVGHAYYARSRAVFNDIYYLIRNGLKAEDRAGIARVVPGNYFTLV